MKQRNMPFSRQSGFTLVELAIVIIIIGLLIGGVLKGDELIQNARATSFAKQVRSYEVALASFRTIYGTFPGDVQNPASRMQDCLGDCVTNVGNNSKSLDGGAGSWAAPYRYLPTHENQIFWWQLAGAGLIDDVSSVGTNGATITPAWGVTSPMTSFNEVGLAVFAMNIPATVTTSAMRGIYVYPRRSNATCDNCQWAEGMFDLMAFTANQAQMIDIKLDDGNPAQGRARAVPEGGGGSGCDGTAYDGQATNAQLNNCTVTVRIGEP